MEMRELIKYTKSQNIKSVFFAIWQLFLHGPLFELSRGSASAQLKQRSMQEKLPDCKTQIPYSADFVYFY